MVEATRGRGQHSVSKNFPALRTGQLGEWLPWKGGKDGGLGPTLPVGWAVGRAWGQGLQAPSAMACAVPWPTVAVRCPGESPDLPPAIQHPCPPALLPGIRALQVFRVR